MNPDFSNISRPLRLIALDIVYANVFYDLVNDPEVRLFFEHFRNTKEAILERMPDKASDINNQEYWLVAEDDTIVAYATIKKNVLIYKALHPQPQIDVNHPDFFASFDLTEEEDRAKQIEEKTLAPYAIDIIVHRNHRRKGIAVRTFFLLVEVVRKRGANEVFLEVHKDNEPSRKLLEKLNCEMVFVNERLYYPSYIYRFALSRN